MQHLSTPKIILCALLCGFFSLSAQAASTYLPVKTSVVDSMTKVSNWFISRWPNTLMTASFVGDMSTYQNSKPPSLHESNMWTRAVYFEGLMQLYNINKSSILQTRIKAWGDKYTWTPRTGVLTTIADNQCCGQPYIEFSFTENAPTYRTDITTCINNMLTTTDLKLWWWIDAFQMAMPVFAQLENLDNTKGYSAKMYALYNYTKTKYHGVGLYNTTDHLWYRDSTFISAKTTSGKPIYWSRGNGWVIAAYVRTLSVLPVGDSHRAEYIADFQNMMAKLITLQNTSGYWDSCLGDNSYYGGPETSGTALFAYGLAWGINNNLLDYATYYPPLAKAWNFLETTAIQHVDNPNTATLVANSPVYTSNPATGSAVKRWAAGSLNYVQGSGSKPFDGYQRTADDRPDYDDYGVGCFLLAGSEVYKLAPTALLINVSSSTAALAGAANSTANVNVTSNMTWNISSNQSWLTVTPSVATTGNATLTLTATSSNSGSVRTAIVTISGTGVASKTITVTQDITTDLTTETNNTITIYPNPVTDRLQVSGIKGVAKLTITDIYGKSVLYKEITDNEYVSMASLHSGMYIVKVSTSEGTFEKKVLKK